MVAPAGAASTMGGEDWGTNREWGADAAPAPSKDWGDVPSKDWAVESAPKEWGADDLQPSGDWGTSVTMQDASSTGTDWA